ncbi:unnamed protein product [Parajaminaea phylloscopi]
MRGPAVRQSCEVGRALTRSFATSSRTCSPPSSSSASSGSSTRPLPATPPKNYASHVPLFSWQKHLVTIGSSLAALANPARGEMIATLSETSGESHLPRLRDDMLDHEEGRRLLVDRPSINTKTVDMSALSTMRPGTLGNEYTKWLQWCRVGPDTRAKVQYISDPELAFVMQRYRECHDFYHLLCGMPVSTLGETVVKIFEAAHFGLPVAYLSSLAGPLRLNADERRLLATELGPWARRMGNRVRERGTRATLLSVYWEEHWDKDWATFKREDLGMEDPPVRVPYEVKRGSGRKKAAWPTQTYKKILDAQE